MKRILPLALAAAAMIAAQPALADRNKHGKGDDRYARAFCPPGLAKKSPACVPPGQAKKYRRDDDRDWHDRDRGDWRDGDRHYYRVGDRIDDRFVYIDNPYRYGLDPDYYYYRSLDRVFRVDPDTRRILAIVGLVDALLN